mmetsp:Transcript_25263/g.39835  ORF Transcript_25263/g.39835 Transcript_25263/m.39835 type:complete len:214 (-) Transcript_25263:259-900(-)
MATAKQEHGQARLANASSHAQRPLVIEDALVELQLRTLGTTTDLQLGHHGLLVHTNTHGGQLKLSLQDGVPHQDVTVEARTQRSRSVPVIIVWSTAIMGLTVGHWVANANDEHSTMLLASFSLPLLGGKVGVLLLQLSGVNKGDVVRQDGGEASELLYLALGPLDGSIDFRDDLLKLLHIAVLSPDDSLPVPLVNVHGVNGVDVFVGPNRVHV